MTNKYHRILEGVHERACTVVTNNHCKDQSEQITMYRRVIHPTLTLPPLLDVQ